MDKKAKRFIAVPLAVVSLFAFSVTGCNPTEVPEEDEATVIFDYNDNSSRPYSVNVGESESIDEPTEPVRTGYTFLYWQTSADGGNKVEFPYTPDGDVTTLYAHWEAQICEVTFDYNYDGAPETMVEQVEYGNTVEKPEDPVRNGYSFYFWQTKADGGSQISFPYTVKNDVTLYARWGQGDMYIISFNANYEGGIVDAEPLEIIPGNTVSKTKMPTLSRIGYTFKGWAESADSTTVISYPYKPTATVTLYAVWVQDTYTVVFANNYVDASASIYTSVSVTGGESVTAPETDPIRDNYSFVGWYTSMLGGNIIEFPYTPTKSTRLYAHWKSDAVTTNTFDAEFTEIDPTKVHYGYSGSVTGTGIIIEEDGANSHSEEYPLNSSVASHTGHYISYLYAYGDTLTFVINSSEAVSGVTLIASLTTEIATNLTIGPTGENSFQFIVNGAEINYSPITFTGTKPSAGTYKGTFSEYTISTNISLNAGENIIQLVTNNTNGSGMGGGTLRAVAPMVDYIRLVTTATLSWSPVYDNLYKWT